MGSFCLVVLFHREWSFTKGLPFVRLIEQKIPIRSQPCFNTQSSQTFLAVIMIVFIWFLLRNLGCSWRVRRRQCAVCSVQCAVCCVHCRVCSVWCSMRSEEHHLWRGLEGSKAEVSFWKNLEIAEGLLRATVQFYIGYTLKVGEFSSTFLLKFQELFVHCFSEIDRIIIINQILEYKMLYIIS